MSELFRPNYLSLASICSTVCFFVSAFPTGYIKIATMKLKQNRGIRKQRHNDILLPAPSSRCYLYDLAIAWVGHRRIRICCWDPYGMATGRTKAAGYTERRQTFYIIVYCLFWICGPGRPSSCAQSAQLQHLDLLPGHL